MDKKQYSAPSVKQVSLEMKNTVLGFCHSSPNMFPNEPTIGLSCNTPVQGNSCPATP